ncbi:hypothetical protein DAMA08_032060 [Martiniozyma asiatica (nom. inval.)]|nr:hypothetical protein DAMA08_032060 [Martiniozyma asiatica]
MYQAGNSLLSMEGLAPAYVEWSMTTNSSHEQQTYSTTNFVSYYTPFDMQHLNFQQEFDCATLFKPCSFQRATTEPIEEVVSDLVTTNVKSSPPASTSESEFTPAFTYASTSACSTSSLTSSSISAPSSTSSSISAPSSTSSSTLSSSTSLNTSKNKIQKKRPRRRYGEIERYYKCIYSGCTKAYGTLNHLNTHIGLQNHGSKRNPKEFKELRKSLKLQKAKVKIRPPIVPFDADQSGTPVTEVENYVRDSFCSKDSLYLTTDYSHDDSSVMEYSPIYSSPQPLVSYTYLQDSSSYIQNTQFTHNSNCPCNYYRIHSHVIESIYDD